MKILLCTLEYPPQIGGVANYYSSLASSWPQADSFYVLDNAKNDLLAKKGFLPWKKSFFSIFRKWKKLKKPFVLIGQILPLASTAYLLSFFPKFKYGLFLHGLDFSLATRSRRKRFITKRILKRSQLIVCANSKLKKLLLSFDNSLEKKIIVINPGVIKGEIDRDYQAAVKKLYNLESKKIIFSLGRLVRRKGFDQAIKALAGLNDRNYLYFISGQGEDRLYLEKLVKSFESLKDKVFFLGNLSEREKWSWLDLCDIFIMPSRDIEGDFEGFGIVYLEANLMAKPVIAGDSGGVRDAVVNLVNGLLVDPQSTSDITRAIVQLINDDDLANKLGLSGRERTLNHFNWDKQAMLLFEKIKEIEKD